MIGLKQPKALNPRSPDTKYVGEEPQWTAQPTEARQGRLITAFNWYNHFYGKRDAKEFAAAYLDRRNRTADAKRLRSLPDTAMRLVLGWLCRMADMGLVLTKQEQERVDTMLKAVLNIRQNEPEARAPDAAPRVTIQDRMRDRVIECAGELEGMFDEFVTKGRRMSNQYRPLDMMRNMNLAPQMVNLISEVWQLRLSEFEQVIEGRDPQLVEGYDSWTKIDLRNCVKFCEQVIADCGAYVQIKKVERKPRKKKAVSPEKLTRRFKYLKESTDPRLKSIEVTSLVNASEAWLYNVKKRKLIHVVADPHAGAFTVKGNTVIGINPGETVQKTLRKPAEQLRAIMAAGKPAARKVFKDIRSTEVKWNGRGNDDLILLRAW